MCQCLIAAKNGLVGAHVELPEGFCPTGTSPVTGDEGLGSEGSASGRGSWARQGSLFMGLLGQVLEHVRCVGFSFFINDLVLVVFGLNFVVMDSAAALFFVFSTTS